MQQNPYQAPYNAAQAYNAPQGYPQAYGSPPGQAAAGYEFTPLENSVLGSTAGWTRGAGIIQAIVGGLMLLAAIFAVVKSNIVGGITNGLAATVYLVIGFALLSAASSLGRVVSTQGDDIQHLMEAMKAYERAFKIQVLLVILAVVIGLVAGFLAVAIFGGR